MFKWLIGNRRQQNGIVPEIFGRIRLPDPIANDDLPLAIYSTPGSRWVDPALGVQRPKELPPLYEVYWRMGEVDVTCDDPLANASGEGRLRKSLLRMLAVYIAALHDARGGAVRYHYYCRREASGYLKIDANGELIACAFDLGVQPSRDVFLEFARIRQLQKRVAGMESSAIAFVPIVLFGAEENFVFYIESMYGIPRSDAYFNTRALEFLARLCQALPELSVPVIKEASIAEQIEFLRFEPMLEKQIVECPESLREPFADQLARNVRLRCSGSEGVGQPARK